MSKILGWNAGGWLGEGAIETRLLIFSWELASPARQTGPNHGGRKVEERGYGDIFTVRIGWIGFPRGKTISDGGRGRTQIIYRLGFLNRKLSALPALQRIL